MTTVVLKTRSTRLHSALIPKLSVDLRAIWPSLLRFTSHRPTPVSVVAHEYIACISRYMYFSNFQWTHLQRGTTYRWVGYNSWLLTNISPYLASDTTSSHLQLKLRPLFHLVQTFHKLKFIVASASTSLFSDSQMSQWIGCEKDRKAWSTIRVDMRRPI